MLVKTHDYTSANANLYSSKCGMDILVCVNRTRRRCDTDIRDRDVIIKGKPKTILKTKVRFNYNRGGVEQFRNFCI